jgi:hypothetical protein
MYSYKRLKKEIKKDYRRWKDLPRSFISRISILKMAIQQREIYMFNAIPTKIPKKVVTEIEMVCKLKRLHTVGENIC